MTTFVNTFHNTTASVRGEIITPRTYRRIRRALCANWPTCKCPTDSQIGCAEELYDKGKLIGYRITGVPE